jgi:hypothetical protein
MIRLYSYVFIFFYNRSVYDTLLAQHSEQALLVDYEQAFVAQVVCSAFYSSSNGDFNIIHFQFNFCNT